MNRHADSTFWLLIASLPIDLPFHLRRIMIPAPLFFGPSICSLFPSSLFLSPPLRYSLTSQCFYLFVNYTLRIAPEPRSAFFSCSEGTGLIGRHLSLYPASPFFFLFPPQKAISADLLTLRLCGMPALSSLVQGPHSLTSAQFSPYCLMHISSLSLPPSFFRFF